MHLLLSYTLTSFGILILCLAMLTFLHSLIHKFTKQKISELSLVRIFQIFLMHGAHPWPVAMLGIAPVLEPKRERRMNLEE